MSDYTGFLHPNRFAAQRIEEQYNPEFDVNPDGPKITWAEYQLLQMIKELIARVEQLEDERPSRLGEDFTNKKFYDSTNTTTRFDGRDPFEDYLNMA